jgi:hypothetical protein
MSAELPAVAGQRDWFGIGCSALCVIHCAAPLVLAVSGGSLAGIALLGGEWLHLPLLLLVPAIAVWSLLPAHRRHGRRAPVLLALLGVPLLFLAVVLGGAAEPALSITGGLVMIAAHALNRHYLLASSPPGALR